ncbi:MAG: glycosyl transferase [Actinomycetaceae bacterium]|nr:glycosyl transferase [Arcanobacterium sp.]MDD7687692.1 glycosyl transferase [Actinomycetaceae bacterium]MDY5273916.1 glycosyl transferase [Arcanobacterium sp.]
MFDAVDVIIACHSEHRPVGRAVRSVLVGNGEYTRAIVVCHNIEAKRIRAVIPSDLRDRAQYVELNDGIHSPAGPFNYGLRCATAPWVAVMGSDDELQAGAVRSWLALSKDADAVIARTELNGRTVPTPPVRIFPHRWCSPVKDRLFYQSAPLGLMRREFLKEHQLSFTSGLATGEDLEFSFRLWTEGKIRVQRRGPAYQINSDARDRVTMRLAPAADELKHCEVLWARPDLIDSSVREAIAFKYLRIHFFGFAWMRAQHNAWQTGDREYIARWLRVILDAAPRCVDILSRADRRLIRALLDTDTPLAELNAAALARRNFRTFTTLIPASWRMALHREAPLRFMTSSAVTRALR